jgi:ribonuclease-3
MADAQPRYNAFNRAVTERDVACLLTRYGVSASCLDASIFQNAFVHRSYRGSLNAEAPAGCMPLQPADYERLENLGDAVVQLAVTDYLHERYPDESEAFISQLRSKVVSGSVLAELSFSVGLTRWVLLSAQAEADRARDRPCVAEDIFESFVAAVFKVHGYEAAKAWVVGVVHEHLDIPSLIFSLRCSKDRLVRFCADRHGFRPVIKTTSAHGTEASCRVLDSDGRLLAESTGDTARQAELSACQLAWEALVRRA